MSTAKKLALAGLGAAALGGAWLALRPSPSGPDAVLIVLDTVRSDHTSLCGASRPTSPNLIAFARTAGHTCDAVAPGSWTLPSHASFFTGVTPLEHGAHEITSGVKDFSGSASRSRPLKKKGIDTLAEQLSGRGYHTVAVSGNPVVSKSMGLTRGFDDVRVAERFGDLAGDDLVAAVAEQLSQAPSDEPLFLFVNIAEAHQTWAQVPGSVDWAEPGPRELLKYAKLSEEDPWRRYVEGRMSADEVAEFDAAIDDLYAYNTFRADQTLGGVLALLEESGRCGADCRVVITSDHGEMLGEHGLLDHGHYVWESNIRVPLLARGVTLPDGPINALHAFHLIRDGRLPDTLTPPIAMAWPHVRRCYMTRGAAFCATSAALWDGDDKLVWTQDAGDDTPRLMRFNLAADPDEASPLPLTEHPRLDELLALAEAVKADAGEEDEVDQSVTEALRAAGYLE
jgi:arylsulfatase A-like enzyme